MILLWLSCYKYGIYVYPTWIMLKTHPLMKSMIFIQTCVMTDHIFITCCWSVVLRLNLLEMRIRNYKIYLRQRSCYPNQFNICLISKTQYEHVTFMTIHYNTKRWWGTITSRPNVMPPPPSHVPSICRLCPIRYQPVPKAPNPLKLLPNWHLIQIHPPIIWALINLLNVSWWALVPTLATIVEHRFSGMWRPCTQ